MSNFTMCGCNLQHTGNEGFEFLYSEFCYWYFGAWVTIGSQIVNFLCVYCFTNLCCFAFFLAWPCVPRPVLWHDWCRYRPSIAVSFVESELGFTEDEQCLKFLQDLGVVLTQDGTKIDCKQSQGILAASWPVPNQPKPTRPDKSSDNFY